MTATKCPAGTVTEQDPEIAPPREKLTTRAGRWATRQAGRARPVDEVASELSWHPVNASVRRWGCALLDADTGRDSDGAPGPVQRQVLVHQHRRRRPGPAIGHSPRQNRQSTRTWLLSRPLEWLEQIRWGVLDLSGPYRAAFDTALPHAHQVGTRSTSCGSRPRRGPPESEPDAGTSRPQTPSIGPAKVVWSENITDPDEPAAGPARRASREVLPGESRRGRDRRSDEPGETRAGSESHITSLRGFVGSRVVEGP